MIFYIKKCKVRVNFYFFALMCTAAFFDQRGIMIWGLLASMLHECGHLTAMFFLPGHAPREVSITPFGMRIGSSPLAEFEKGSLTVMAAGSAVNLISAAVTFGFFPDFAAVSLVLGMMNLLPVEGMDGGGILRNILERTVAENAAARVVGAVSWMTLAAMLLVGIYVLIATGSNFTIIGVTVMLALTRLHKTPFFQRCGDHMASNVHPKK